MGSGNAGVLRSYGFFAAEMGHIAPALAAVSRGVQLDPFNYDAHYALGAVLTIARRFGDAI